MTRTDVDVVLRAFDALNRGDVDAFVSEMDAEVVFEQGDVFLLDLSPVYHGHEGVRRWFQEAIVEPWEILTADPLELRDEGGGRVVQVIRLSGRGRGSGAEVEMRIRQTLTIREGRIKHRQIEEA